MDYNKPSKADRDLQYLMRIGFSSIQDNPYQEEKTPQNKKFLIICEGANTEYHYFSSFPVPTNMVEIKGGKGSKNALVDYAIELQNDPKYADREIWCVYDFDVKPDERATQIHDFNSSIIKAKANNLKVAWSNDCFELWFLLHYNYLDNCITRNEIYEALKSNWNLRSFHNTAKTVEFCKDLYDLHGGDQSEMQKFAVNNAIKLHRVFENSEDFAQHCPCTTVYQLVKELNKYLKPYSSEEQYQTSDK